MSTNENVNDANELSRERVEALRRIVARDSSANEADEPVESAESVASAASRSPNTSTFDGATRGSTSIPRFSLRTLLLLVAGAAALCGVTSVLSVEATVALLFFLSLVLAHVAANAWGTRVGFRPAPRAARLDAPPLADKARVDRAVASAGVTPLMRRRRLGVATFAMAAIGALLGAVAGVIIRVAFLHGLPMPGTLVVTLSVAAIGGNFGFLLATFFRTSLGAWAEATRGASARERKPWWKWWHQNR